jgi:hypothetical protein
MNGVDSNLKVELGTELGFDSAVLKTAITYWKEALPRRIQGSISCASSRFGVMVVPR